MLPKVEVKKGGNARPPAMWGMPNLRSKESKVSRKEERKGRERKGNRPGYNMAKLGEVIKECHAQRLEKGGQKTDLVCTRHLACTCDAHRSRRTLLAPA